MQEEVLRLGAPGFPDGRRWEGEWWSWGWWGLGSWGWRF